MNKRIFRVLIISIFILLITITYSYAFYKDNIIGNMIYEEIEKTDDNLGIVKRREVTNIKDPLKEIREEKRNRLQDVIDKRLYLINEDAAVEYDNKDQIYRIALIGTDSRGDNRGRSDVIIVASINIDKKEITLTSFMRDIQIIIDNKYEKLNYSYLHGGGVGVLRALNSNYELDVRDYIVVDMFNLRDLIDKMGKVSVDIKPDQIDEINYRITEAAGLQEREDFVLLENTGIQDINGEQAVAYMRIRHTGMGDVDRTGRQREVLEKLMRSSIKKDIIQIMNIASESARLITTSLNQDEIEGIIIDVLPILKDATMKSQVFPNGNLAYDDDIDGEYYWILRDRDEFISELKTFMDY